MAQYPTHKRSPQAFACKLDKARLQLMTFSGNFEHQSQKKWHPNQNDFADSANDDNL